MADREPAIIAEGLQKGYGRKKALDGLDMTVPGGTVHGVLGPNGSGKTTLVRTLATLLRVEAGRARVAGVDVARRPDEVRRRIGLLGQHAALEEDLSGRQNLELFGRLHHLGRRRAAARAGELLKRFGLADTGRKPVKTYSGGMRRRLDLAASLIIDPQILFLDEPTTGLDPRGRTEVWNAVRSLAEAGTTVLLTTQYLEEADRLADRISVIDHGRVIADGTPDQLKTTVGADRLDMVVHDAGRLEDAAAVLARIPGTGAVDVDEDDRKVSAPVADRMSALNHLIRALRDAGVEVEDLGKGLIDRLRSMPMAPSAVLAGRAIADMLESAAGLLIMIGAGLAIGWRWHGPPAAALAAVGLLLLLRLAMLWCGIWLGLIVGRPELVMAVQILIWPVAFSSGVFASPESMPGWLGAIAAWNPMTASATAVRDLFGNPGVTDASWAAEHALPLAVAWPLALLAIAFPMAAARFRALGRRPGP